MLFHQPDFVRIWAVGGLTNTTRWMEILVIGVYAYQISGSAVVVSLLLFARMCPYLLFGAVAGAVVERLDRRRTLSAMLMVLTAGSIALAWLAVSGRIEL